MVAGRLLSVLVAAAVGVFANPVVRELQLHDATLLPQDIIDSWTEPANYAGAAYCASQLVQEWDCGGACSAITTKPRIVAIGGDNRQTPLWYVAQNGTHVIVSIAGTNIRSWGSILNDLRFRLVDANTDWFPDAPNAQVHRGFQLTYGRMVDDIDAAVRSEVEAGTKDVLVVGHSQGGALAYLAAVHIQRTMPDTKVVARTFAVPRVGNKAWADYVDATLGVYGQHMNNLNDLISQLPPDEFGYVHSGNEIWIQDAADRNYVSCPAQESKECQGGLGLRQGFLSFFRSGELLVHLGHYAGVRLADFDCKHLVI